ncbi:hypothetical protein ACU8NW_02455 [Rhizobium leguminosarum]
MFTTEEVSLVDFYRSGLALARDAQYEIVLCLVAREADAPGAYDEVFRTWTSLDDLTGPNILFLFAGSSAREHHASQNILDWKSQHVLFSPHALLLPSHRLDSQDAPRRMHRSYESYGHHDLDFLRKHEGSERGRTDARPIPSRVAKHRPHDPNASQIRRSHTSQISDLRNYLALRESDIPCLHMTFLDGSPAKYLKLTDDVNLYATMKGLVEALGSEVVKGAHAEIRSIEQRLATLTQARRQLEGKAIPPDELFHRTAFALQAAAAQDESGSVDGLITALLDHLRSVNGDTRRLAFAAFKSAQPVLRQGTGWSEIRAGVQRLIDIADRAHPIDTWGDTKDQVVFVKWRQAALAQNAADTDALLSAKANEEKKLEAILAQSTVQTRFQKVIGGAISPFAKTFIAVAAQQELEAIRAYLDTIGAKRVKKRLSRTFPSEHVSAGADDSLSFTLVLAPGQAVEDMSELLTVIQTEASPETVLLVGMMAGLPGKSKLLDVQAPRNIINATRLGTRDGHVVPEPHGRDVDPTLHNLLQTLDRNQFGIGDIQIVTRKKSACVSAKFDDLTPELAQAALACDPENVVGIEMEGSALTARQAAQRRSGESTGYLMIKGVADYAGAKPLADEVKSLHPALEQFSPGAAALLADPDPTSNKPLKSVLQEMATVRAMRVALALLTEISQADHAVA